MTGYADEGARVIETDALLNDYVQDLRAHDETRIMQVAEPRGPVEVYQVTGYSSHVLIVNKCPFGEHDAEEAEARLRLEAQGWRCFAVALNPEHEWSVEHWEPLIEARPLPHGLI